MSNVAVKTEFRQVRDFGEVFGVSFEFIRQNFKPLCTGVLYIGGPFLLVGSAVLTLMLVRTVSLVPGEGTGFDAVAFGVTYFVNILSLLAGAVMITSVVNGYIKLYMESPEAKPQIGVNELWRQVRQDFWWVAGRLFLLSVLAFVYFGLLIGMGVAVFASGSSVGLKVAFGFIYVFGLIAAGMYFYVYGFCIFPTQSYFERTSLGGSFSRVPYLVKGHWWQTFGVAFIGSIIQSVVASILYLPFYFILIFAGLFSIQSGGTPNTSLLTVAGVGMSVGLTLGYGMSFIINFVLMAVQYYNLLEGKESTGLLNKIESLGTVPTAAKTDFYDEEEKY
ncbi:MAG: hypothetical protein MUD08_15365 [Cytophagales bacterium]|nr:hypothetical protein [Cytophagales bacterium]